jgi:hypothetical protein
MKFKDILNINKALIKLKEENKTFDFELASILVNNLNITNKIVDKQNEKLTLLLTKLGEFDGYEYVIPNNEFIKSKYDEISEEDIQCDGLINITTDQLKNCKFDLTSTELIMPMVKNKK